MSCQCHQWMEKGNESTECAKVRMENPQQSPSVVRAWKGHPGFLSVQGTVDGNAH